MAYETDFKPRLRPVEVLQVKSGQRPMVGLRDPTQVAPEPVVLSPDAYAIVALMDGSRDLRDIQMVYFRRGTLIPMEKIAALVEDLDGKLFLDSPHFARTRTRQEDLFAASPVRPAVLAGKAYAGDPASLEAQLGGYYTHEHGPLGHARAGAGAGVDGMRVRAAVVPHIDPPRGGPVYAWAYRHIAQSPAGLVVVLGTSHTPTGFYFTVTTKDFETPLGNVPTDTRLVEDLAGEFGRRVFDGEIVHASEHSMEFAALWLRHTWPRAAFKILPILCGDGHEDLMRGRPLEESEVYVAFIDRLHQIVREHDALVLASADLAHMGPRFGDPRPLSGQDMEALEADDLRMIERITAPDAEGFRSNVWDERDRRKVCGFLPIYAMLKVMDARQGHLLSYRQWPDPNAVVSYAAIVFG